MRFRILTYNLISCLLAPLLVVVIFLRHLIKQRPVKLLFGTTARSQGSYYWIQAPSAGEVILAKTLIEHLEAALPSPNWLIITSTYSGYCTAQQIIGAQAVVVYLYSPLDFTYVIKNLIRRYPPLALIMVESDLRPNLVDQLSRKAVKIMMVNGQISLSQRKRYWWLGYFLKDSWEMVDFYSVKSAADRAAFIALGAPKARIRVNGDLKFDQKFPKINLQQRRKLTTSLGLANNCRLIVAGSTHPGEEELILDALQRIWEHYPEVVLLIAPRHLQRVPEIEALLNSRNLGYWLRSQASPTPGARIIILDTYGELAVIYSLAEVAIVGYSFIAGGGHNILEPIGYGSPVFFGPNMKHFQDIADQVMAAGIGFQVEDSSSLATGCLRFLRDQELRHEATLKAQKLIQENRGAAQRNVDMILAVLGRQRGSKEKTLN